jgi:hypothetical protein
MDIIIIITTTTTTIIIICNFRMWIGRILALEELIIRPVVV